MSWLFTLQETTAVTWQEMQRQQICNSVSAGDRSYIFLENNGYIPLIVICSTFYHFVFG